MGLGVFDERITQINDGQFRVQHVAVLIETETSWGGRVIRGIAHFAEKHTHWHLLIDPRDHEQRSAVPDGWQGDGIIARITNRTQWQQIREKNLPVVNVDDVMEGLRSVGTVITDEAERARLALEHLVARGFRKFAYFAPPSNRYSKNRGEAFIRAVTKLGHECHEYSARLSGRAKDRLGGAAAEGESLVGIVAAADGDLGGGRASRAATGRDLSFCRGADSGRRGDPGR